NIVPDRDFLQLPRIDQTLVYTLEPPTENDGAGTVSQFANLRLCQRLSARAHQKARARILCRSSRINRAGKNVGSHHHAGTAAGRRVIDAAMLVEREVADLHGVERPRSLAHGATCERLAERP